MDIGFLVPVVGVQHCFEWGSVETGPQQFNDHEARKREGHCTDHEARTGPQQVRFCWF